MYVHVTHNVRLDFGYRSQTTFVDSGSCLSLRSCVRMFCARFNKLDTPKHTHTHRTEGSRKCIPNKGFNLSGNRNPTTDRHRHVCGVLLFVCGFDVRLAKKNNHK